MGERADEMREYTNPDTPNYSPLSQRDASGGFTGSDAANYDAGSTDDTSEVQTGMLQEDIEQTRAEMARTVDEIQERLTPQNIVEQVKETAKDTATETIDNVKHAVREATVGKVENMVNIVSDSARETGSGLLDLIKENPVPAALAGLGLGWLYMKNQDKGGKDSSRMNYAASGGYYSSYPRPMTYTNSAPDYRPTNSNGGLIGKIMDNPIPAAIAGASIGYMFMKGPGQNNNTSYSTYTGQNSSQGLDQVKGKVGDMVDTAGQKAGNLASGAGDMAEQVTHKAGEIAGGTADMAGNVVEGVQQGAQQATNQLERMIQENPLAVGGVALVLGAVIGMMLPATEKENQLMGKAHDTVMEKAGEAVQQTMDKVGNVAGEVTNTAKEEAKNQGLTK